MAAASSGHGGTVTSAPASAFVFPASRWRASSPIPLPSSRLSRASFLPPLAQAARLRGCQEPVLGSWAA